MHYNRLYNCLILPRELLHRGSAGRDAPVQLTESAAGRHARGRADNSGGRSAGEGSTGSNSTVVTVLGFVLIHARIQDERQWIERRCFDQLQRVGVVMIEGLRAAFDQKLRLDVVRPAAVVVEGDIAAVAGRAEGFIEKLS